jgi:tyrosinase
MTVSRRRFIKRATVLASAAALPSWLSDSLFAQTAQPLVRHNINSTDPQAVEAVRAYRSAVAAMKSRKPHEPTSWQFQANIHSWPGQFGAVAPNAQKEFNDVFASDKTHEPLARKVWGTCTHGDPTVSFLPWHRLYLFFFERIMRAAAGQSGSSRLGLLYWDWTKDRVLPLAFREQVNGSQSNNPLYWDIRRESATRLNNPAPLPSASANANTITTLLGRNNFSSDLDPTVPLDFNDGLESGPHGQVHVFVGVQPRGMGFFEEAGRDPCFWTHHCNIDRIWSHWRQRQGHLNPVDARVPVGAPPNQQRAWSDMRHTFVDANGKEVVLTTGQVLVAAQILDGGYVYDDLLPAVVTAAQAPSPEVAPPPAPSAPRRPRTLASGGALQVDAGRASVILQSSTAAAAPLPGGVPEAPIRDRVLVLKDIAAAASGDSLYGVYVNLPPNEQPTPDSPYFVGLIDTFTAAATGRQMTVPEGSVRQDSGTAHSHSRGPEKKLSLNEALTRQNWTEGQPISVTVVPVQQEDRLASPQATTSAAAPIPGPALKIGGIDILGY